MTDFQLARIMILLIILRHITRVLTEKTTETHWSACCCFSLSSTMLSSTSPPSRINSAHYVRYGLLLQGISDPNLGVNTHYTHIIEILTLMNYLTAILYYRLQVRNITTNLLIMYNAFSLLFITKARQSIPPIKH